MAWGLMKEQGAQAAGLGSCYLPDFGLRASFPVASRSQVSSPSSPALLPPPLAGGPVPTTLCPTRPSWAAGHYLWPQRPSPRVHGELSTPEACSSPLWN